MIEDHVPRKAAFGHEGKRDGSAGRHSGKGKAAAGAGTRIEDQNFRQPTPAVIRRSKHQTLQFAQCILQGARDARIGSYVPDPYRVRVVFPVDSQGGPSLHSRRGTFGEFSFPA